MEEYARYDFEEEEEDDELSEEEIEEEVFLEEEDERVDWCFEKDEQIFNLKYLKFKPFTTAYTNEEKYRDACALTSNLANNQFARYLPKKRFKMTYYDKPYKEYHVEGKFLHNIDTVEIKDVDASYDLIYHLFENAQVMSEIKSIMFSNCNINAELLKVLTPKLEEIYYLTSLDLSHNPIGDDGLRVIVKYLHYWTFLKELSLFDTQITSAGLERLASLYSKHALILTKLNLGQNQLISQKTIAKLFMGFAKKNVPLEELVMSNCSLQGRETALHFELFLIVLKNLRYLDLSFNLFSTTEEIIPLVNLFTMSNSLQVMVLNFNPLCDLVLMDMLDRIFDSPRSEKQKTLYIQNITIPQTFFKEKWNLFNRPDIKVEIGGVRRIHLPKIDDFKHKLLKRFNFLYRKENKKKDIVVKTLEEYLPAKQMNRIKVDDFKEALMLIGKIDFALIQNIVTEFAGNGTRANVREFIEMYNEMFPPKPKPLIKGTEDRKKKVKTEKKGTTKKKIK